MTPDQLAGGLETLELLSGIVFGADETTAALPGATAIRSPPWSGR